MSESEVKNIIKGEELDQKIKELISEKIKNYDNRTENENRFRPTLYQHYPNFVARRRAESEFRASGLAARNGSGGLCFVDKIYAPQSEKSEMV